MLTGKKCTHKSTHTEETIQVCSVVVTDRKVVKAMSTAHDSTQTSHVLRTQEMVHDTEYNASPLYSRIMKKWEGLIMEIRQEATIE